MACLHRRQEEQLALAPVVCMSALHVKEIASRIRSSTLSCLLHQPFHPHACFVV